MIGRVKNTAAVILAVAGMAFGAVAMTAASAVPAGAASVRAVSAAGPDFICPAKAVCTFYGEELNNTPHTWWPGNRSGKWYSFHNLGVNNPGSARNKSSHCVWFGTQAGGTGGTYRNIDGNTGGALVNMHHEFGWFYITGGALCLGQPPN
jgi:hypothetical protein